MAFITADNLKHSFVYKDEEDRITGEVTALDGIDLMVEPGQFIAVLGRNGSGKSTFARHLNALLTPTEGTLIVDGKDTKNEDLIWEIRRACGMIFQNPDNQIVAGIVEEDVAFGPENLGVPTEEIEKRVEDSLDTADMTAYRHSAPENLSGGQKQRVAVAGVLAMQPKCIIMDEPTAMLDPAGRREVMETAQRLNRENGVTIILITHFMEEAAQADFVFVLDEGRVVMQGTPRDIFSAEDQLKRHGLSLPQIAGLSCELRKDGYSLPEGILTRTEMEEALCALIGQPEKEAEAENASGEGERTDPPRGQEKEDWKEKLRLADVSYTYSRGTASETAALKNVNLTVGEGEMIGLIGPTGSGKSTLIQLMDGLLLPDSGTVFYEGQDIRTAAFDRRRLRGNVGLVFQFAESQLFESTVLKDVAYGPKNLGCSREESFARAKSALRQVELNETCWEMSPFELSGGQRRRAAIAGVLAMEPTVLILDEPTAGLDPKGKEDLFGLIRSLHDRMRITVMIVSHDMEDMADLVERIVVLKDGGVMLDGTPAQVFSHGRELADMDLAVPEVTRLMEDLRKKGYPVGGCVTTVDEAKKEIGKLC